MNVEQESELAQSYVTLDGLNAILDLGMKYVVAIFGDRTPEWHSAAWLRDWVRNETFIREQRG